jgi:Cu/Ag efflux protein CusF
MKTNIQKERMDSMKKVLVVTVAVVLMLSLATVVFAQATQGAVSSTPTGVVREREAVMTATVVAIDLQQRIVTLKGENGEIRDLKVGEEAVNLPQVKVGDLVTVKFYESIAVEVIKPGTVAGAGETSAIVRAKPGEMPGGMAARKVSVTATIMAIDKQKSTLTLKGPEGKPATVKVLDPANLEKVKVGDELMITYTEALAISVEHVKAK